MDYRFKHTVDIIRFPEGFTEEDRGIKECCKHYLKLADQTDEDSYKNDITGIYIKISDPADVVTFTIKKCGNDTPLTLYGDIGVFPEDNLVVGYIFDWRQYLINYGSGAYVISIDFTISGITGGYEFGQYELLNYSIANASGTVRCLSSFNSYYQKDLVDFTNSNFRDSIRFPGFFGNREPNTDVKNLITKGRTVEKSTRENVNMYTLRTNPIDIMISKDLIDLHLLNEDGCLFSDHNAYNHDYNIFDRPVVLEETIEVEYLTQDRAAKVTAKFGDRKKLDKSYYNLQ